MKMRRWAIGCLLAGQCLLFFYSELVKAGVCPYCSNDQTVIMGKRRVLFSVL